MKRRAAALTVACAVLVLMGARQSWAGEAPGVRLRMAQHYELIEGELDRALAIYVELENSPGAIGQQATVGLARTLQKLGRGQEARRRLATIEESSLKGSLRAQVLALRGFLGAAATESKPGAAGLVSVRVKRAPGMPGQGAESSTVTLNFADAKLGDVVSQVARGANLDVVVSPSMSGRRITARLSRAEPVGALRVLAHAAGAELGEWAGTITLAAPDEIGRMVLGRSSAGSPPSTATVVLVAARIYAPARGDAPRKLLSKPSVAVRDGELARIQVRSSHAKTSGAGRVPVDEDQFDLDLQVKPTVGLDSDDVKLDVDVSLARTEPATVGARVRQQRRTATVRVKDGAVTTFGLGPDGSLSRDDAQLELQVFTARQDRGVPIDARPWVLAWKEVSAAGAIETVGETGSIPPGKSVLVADGLETNKDALDGLVKLSRADKVAGFDETPNFKMVRTAARALTARGVLKARAGQTSEAIEDWLAVVRCGRAVAWGAKGQGALIDAMLGYAIEGTAVNALANHANSGAMTAEQARDVLAELARRSREGLPTIARILRNEGRWTEDALGKIMAPELKSDDRWKSVLDTFGAAAVMRTLKKEAPRVGAEFERCAASYERGKPELPSELAKTDPRGASMEEQVYLTALRSAFPNLKVAEKRFAEREAKVAALKAACGKLAAK